MDVAQDTASLGNVSENRHAAIFVVDIGFIAFDSIVIALRVFVRAFMLRPLEAYEVRDFYPYDQ